MSRDVWKVSMLLCPFDVHHYVGVSDTDCRHERLTEASVPISAVDLHSQTPAEVNVSCSDAFCCTILFDAFFMCRTLLAMPVRLPPVGKCNLLGRRGPLAPLVFLD